MAAVGGGGGGGGGGGCGGRVSVPHVSEAARPSALGAALRAMPKVELHRHLEGSIRFATLRDLYPAPDTGDTGDAPSDAAVRAHFCITEPTADLAACMQRFEHTRLALATADVVERVAFEVVEDCARDGVVLAELRYSPAYVALDKPWLTMESVHSAVMAGVRRAQAAYPRIAVGLIGIIDRNRPLDECERAADFIVAHRSDFIAMDLANDEARFPCVLFERIFARARDAGLRVTCHAGEVPDDRAPQWVRDAVTRLRAERIGHGLHVMRDAEVTAWAAERGVVFEVCPRSNVLVGAVESAAEHPLRRMIAAGLACTVNSDDPGLFDIDLSSELEVAVTDCGLSLQQVVEAMHVAAAASFLPPLVKQRHWDAAALDSWYHSVRDGFD